MKIPIINDLHFGVRNDDPYFMNMQLSWISEHFIPYLQTNNIEAIINLGDTWDKRRTLNIRTLQIFRDAFFKKLHKLNIKQYTCLGNHDVYYKDSNEINSMTNIASEFSTIEMIDDYDMLNDNILLCSWVNNNNIEKIINAINSKQWAWVLGHFEIRGALLLKGVVCEHGFEPSVFENCNNVGSGHFHLPSEINNIKYFGNQFQLTWSDYNIDKGFHVLDTETNEVEFVRNPDKFNIYVLENLDAVNITDKEKYRNKIVRINVESLSKQSDEITQIRNFLNPIVHSLEIVETNTLIDNIEIDSNIVNDLQDDKELITDIINDLPINDNDNIKKDELLSRVLSLYDEVIRNEKEE